VGSRLERTERLLNLVFCLMATQRPVPRSAIRSNVAGYGPDGSTEAFERMFERDKEELRGMGIPIETVLDVNGDVAGYRIVPASYRLVDVDLTAQERSAVALAARVWQGAALSEPAIQAFLKLSASADEIGEPVWRLPQFARITADDPRLVSLIRATRERKRVAFTYRALHQDSPAPRTMDPWAIVMRSGNWYLIGFDESQNAPRAYRLSRVRGEIDVLSEDVRSERPRDFDPRAFVDAEPLETVEAVVDIDRGVAADLVRRASIVEELEDRLHVHVTTERELLIGLLTANFSHIRQVSPSSLIHEARERLRLVAEAHGGD